MKNSTISGGVVHALPDDLRQTLQADPAMLAQWEAGMQSPRWVTAPVWRKNLLRKHSMEVVGRDAERKLP